MARRHLDAHRPGPSVETGGGPRGDSFVLPQVFVLLTLGALVLIPWILQRQSSVLWREIAEVAEPSRILVGDVQVAAAFEMAALRGFALRGDPVYVERYESAMADERRALDRLRALAPRLGPQVAAAFVATEGAALAWQERPSRQEMLAGTLDPDVYVMRIPVEEPLWEQLMEASDALREAIVLAEGELYGAILRLERTGLLLTSGLVLLAFLAAVATGWLARRTQRLAVESEERRREMSQLLENRARLIRALTHDVRNPLSAIQGYGQLLQDDILGRLNPRQAEAVGRMREATAAALGLVQDLLDLSMAESGELLLERRPTGVADQVEAALAEARPAAVNAGLELSADVPEGLPAARVDPRRLRQILGNLLSNAIKYTPEGGRVSVRAAVRSGRQAPGRGSWIAVDVSDSGPGIPEGWQEEIFEEFSRLEAGTERGTGLGLAISRRLARAMGGDVTLVSAADRGSTFTLWLPLNAPQRSDRGRRAA